MCGVGRAGRCDTDECCELSWNGPDEGAWRTTKRGGQEDSNWICSCGLEFFVVVSLSFDTLYTRRHSSYHRAVEGTRSSI